MIRRPRRGPPARPDLIGAVVLAAGLARRMGRQKLLLRPPREARRALERRRDSSPRRTTSWWSLVTRRLTSRRRWPVCPCASSITPTRRTGQGSSIAVGVAALAPTTDAVADRSRRPAPATRRRDSGTSGGFPRGDAAIVTPIYRGIQGTPVLFGAEVFPSCAALTGDGGARTVVRANLGRVREVPFDLPVPDDVDTPEDYARLM